LAELVDDVLLSGDLVGRGFLQRAPLQRLVEEERSGREDRSKQIWQLLTLELWCRQAATAGVATP
jgi:asparagine synthase (glutamine-hydrolysing)